MLSFLTTRQTLSAYALHPNSPSLDVAVDTNISASEDLFGKTVSDLQSSISIRTSAITGTLLDIQPTTDAFYSNAGFNPAGGTHFIALHFTADEGASIGVEVIGGQTEGHPVTLDADGLIVIQIANKSEKIKVTATKNTDVETKTYDLTGITLA